MEIDGATEERMSNPWTGKGLREVRGEEGWEGGSILITHTVECGPLCETGATSET